MSTMHKPDAAPPSVQRIMDAIAGCEASDDELREMIAAALADARREGDAEIEQLRAALKRIKSDLFLQIESKHGPRAASEYPSIVQARKALEQQK